MPMTNPFREMLKSRSRPTIGAWCMLNSFNAVEGMAWAGFDWLTIDGEHSPVEIDDMMHHMRIIDASPAEGIVRLLWNDPLLIKRHLDSGAATLMLPFVQNAAEARAAVEQMHYPPRGSRGIAAVHRASRFGAVSDYLAAASDSVFLIVQVETLEAMANLPEILAVDGVDAVFFGPGDLAASMGLTGQAARPEVTEAITGALAQVRAAGKFAGTLAMSEEQAEAFIAADFDFISVTSDANALLRTARSVAAKHTGKASA